jgi:HSP20 family molecular chaperone IbpA
MFLDLLQLKKNRRFLFMFTTLPNYVPKFTLTPWCDTHIWSKDNKIWVELDVPGFKKEEIDVLISSSNRLEVSAENANGRTYYKTFQIPKDLTSNPEAKLENGVLTLIWEVASPYKVPVK